MAVFRDYDQAGLDAQYNNRARVPDFAAHFARWKQTSAAARARVPGTLLDLPYGPSAAERLDVFPAAPKDGKKPPILVFFHGGYWRSLDKGDFSFPAATYVAAGITYVSVNYGLTPTVTLDELVRQAKAAAAWLYQTPDAHGADSERLYVSGHSAGGQLAPLILGEDWGARGLPKDLVKGAVAISGLYDLEPIRLSYLNEGMNLDPASVRRFSPLHQVPARRVGPLALCVGGGESPEFLRQQAEFAAAWKKLQPPPRIADAPGLDHFTVLDAFSDPAAPLFQATCAMALTGKPD